MTIVKSSIPISFIKKLKGIYMTKMYYGINGTKIKLRVNPGFMFPKYKDVEIIDRDDSVCDLGILLPHYITVDSKGRLNIACYSAINNEYYVCKHDPDYKPSPFK
jgi:hypothetical protein